MVHSVHVVHHSLVIKRETRLDIIVGLYLPFSIGNLCLGFCEVRDLKRESLVLCFQLSFISQVHFAELLVI